MKKVVWALIALLAIPLVGQADIPYVPVSGSFTANNQCLTVNPASGQSSGTLDVSGTFSATIAVTYAVGATYSTLTSNQGNASVTTASVNTYSLPTAKIIKVCTTAYVSGTAVVTFAVSSAVSSVKTSGGGSAVFTGSVVGNAGAATPSPAPTGFWGPFVVAQAVAAPTYQPGNIGVSGSVQVFNAGFGTYANCSGFSAVCALTLMVSNAARITSGTSNAWIQGTVPFASATVGVSCSTVVPCKFTWTCTMSSGACTTTQTVPAGATCVITPGVTSKVSTTNLIFSWVTISSTTLTIHVSDELGAATTAYSGNGICL